MTTCALGLGLSGGLLIMSAATARADNLVRNPGFEEVGKQGLPVGWELWAPRDGICPELSVRAARRSGGGAAAVLAAKHPHDAGQIQQTVGPIEGGKWYDVSTRLRTDGVASQQESVWVKVAWLGEEGNDLEKQFVPVTVRPRGWTTAEACLEAPQDAVQARLELGLAWAPGGRVLFDDVFFATGDPQPVRRPPAKLATVCYVPAKTDGPDDNRRQFAEQAALAGAQGADIVCLGEGITLVGTGKSAAECGEPVPGPTTQVLGEVARRHHMYIIVGVYEREGDTLYNTAVLIDREGEIAGRYRKTHLPEAEVRWGITPGTTYPVFETDFATIGIAICYDNFFPEVARSLALNGAEIIFLPIWGDGRDEGRTWDVIARARAIDNAVFFIASNYSEKRSPIIDRWGRILGDTERENGVVVCEADLDARELQPWLSVGCNGEWQRLYKNERRPSTYGPITRKTGP